MYIDQLTLFIIIELAVVYVVITLFMFYRSRLYHVLVAILKEMRWERLRRQQEKQQEMATLQAENKKLSEDYEAARQSAASVCKTFPEQLQDRVEELSKLAREQGINLKRPPSEEDQHQVDWLRCRILELEKQLVSGTIDRDQWRTLSQTAVDDAGLDGGTGRRRGDADEANRVERLTKEANRYLNQFEAAKERITYLENELTDLRSISSESARPFEKPQKGMYADEIYRHKCDKFDMQEKINALKLKLQQMNPDTDDFQQHQEALIRDLEKYIKEADVTLNLLEKELEAINHENSELEAEVRKLKNRLKDLATSEQPAIDRKNVKKLSENSGKQARSVETLRDSIEQLRQGDDQERVLDLQESEIGRLALLVRDSENCMAVLETELEQAQASIDDLSQREKDLLARLKVFEATPEGPLAAALMELTERQKRCLDQFRRQVESVREGEDAARVASRQEAVIDELERMLTEASALIAKLDEAGVGQGRDRLDSNEDIEEMETLLQQFMVDSQSMLSRLKELEHENQSLKQPETNGTSQEA